METLEQRLSFAGDFTSVVEHLPFSQIMLKQTPDDMRIYAAKELRDGSSLLLFRIDDWGVDAPAGGYVYKLLKVLPTGKADTSFGKDGIARWTDTDDFYDSQLLESPTGALYVSGTEYQGVSDSVGTQPEEVIRRFAPNGRADTSFGDIGVATVGAGALPGRIGTWPQASSDVELNADGTLSIQAMSRPGRDLVRLSAEGEVLPASEKVDAFPSETIGGTPEVISVACLLPDGRSILFAEPTNASGASYAALADADGHINRTVGDNGWFARPADLDGLISAVPANDGSIVLMDRYEAVSKFSPLTGFNADFGTTPLSRSQVDSGYWSLSAFSDTHGISLLISRTRGAEVIDGVIHETSGAFGNAQYPTFFADTSYAADGSVAARSGWSFDAVDPASSEYYTDAQMQMFILRRNDGSLVAFRNGPYGDSIVVYDTRQPKPVPILTPTHGRTHSTRSPANADVNDDVTPVVADELASPRASVMSFAAPRIATTLSDFRDEMTSTRIAVSLFDQRDQSLVE